MSVSPETFFFARTVESATARVKTPPALVARAATTANIADLTAASVSVDSVTLIAGDILLVKNQSTASQNGYYGVGTVGSGVAALTRLWPLEDGQEIPNGTLFMVQSGTTNAGTWWYVSNAGTITVGTTGLTFSQLADDLTLTATSAFTAAGSVDAALAELFQNARSVQAQANVPIATAILAAGTPMAAFADNASSNPGITLADSKAVAIRWNNNATQTAIWYTAPMPQDLDDTADIVLHILASKSGATVGDATTFTVTAFFQTAGALHDADADCGGTSSALVGNATAKTVAELTLTILAADVPPSPSTLSFSIKPTNGTLGTDDALVEGLWIEYKRKVLTS